ncbi:MAG: hypothetical protein KA120_07795 [Candidatus Goldbacteria bacterium]|nr:hypothetical protein [Candidatus Goldiibacteriota bacterium]
MKQIYINDGEGILGFVRYIYDDSSTFSHYQRLYYLYDYLGSVSYITGENGLPLQNYTYSPYGTCLNVTDDPINNLQFIGRYGGYKDNDTGLTYFWHRWYDASDGRWVSRDPLYLLLIRISKNCNFINIDDNKSLLYLYQYSFDNPIKFSDKTGLDCTGDFKECVDESLQSAARHEAYIWTTFALCLGTCGVVCMKATLAYPVCFSKCSAICLGGAEALSVGSVAAAIAEQGICRLRWEECKKREEKCKK